MATSTIKKETPAISVITYRPTNDLSAGDKGYFTISVPDEVKNKTILATSMLVRHVAASAGYQLTGAYNGNGDYLYVSYYTPIAIPAVNADIDVMILYW